MKLAIYGAGGMGATVFYLAQRVNKNDSRWDEIIFVDDTGRKTELCGAPVYPFEQARKLFSPKELEFSVSVGEPRGRELIADRVEGAGYSLATLVDPNWIRIYQSTILEPGVIILNDTVSLDCNVTIRKNVLLQTYTVVGHGTVLGPHCSVSPFSMICGDCKIGRAVFFGAHCAVKEDTAVGDHAIVGMGAVVTRDVPAEYTVFCPQSKMVPHEETDGALRGNYML